MKILIVSDTHKKNENYFKVLEMHHPDMVIHCGDAEGSEYALSSAAECPVYIVLGNNDFFSCLDREKDIMIGRYRTLLTHGHYYNVSVGAEYLAEEARARGFDIAMYGHTHRPFYEVSRKPGDKDLIVLNPGSLSYPRQDGHRPSYMLMEIDKEGEAHFALNFL